MTDLEHKRRIVGDEFICVFAEQAHELRARGGPIEFLAQGTLYPDVIESTSHDTVNAAHIKTHHNVGGLPDDPGGEPPQRAGHALPRRDREHQPRQRDTVLVLDCGSQYTRLIARRIRECRLYCEMLPPSGAMAALASARDDRDYVGLMFHSEAVATLRGTAAWRSAPVSWRCARPHGPL